MTKAQRQIVFNAFDAENPKVWLLFLKFTKEAMLKKRKLFGARMIWERMRWYVQIETNDKSYKLNNNHTPFYVRKFIALYPQFKGFFAIRERW